jgi:SagB-type dehydrogenase family enzyme
MTPEAYYRLTELDRASWPEFRDRILQFEANDHAEPRTYPGYPRFALAKVGARLWPPLDRVLRARRCERRLGDAFPAPRVLSRLLRFAHGSLGDHARGPTPSAGGLQAIELYLAHWCNAWLPAGLYHYDRAGHHLSQIGAKTSQAEWHALVPALPLVDGGSLLWILVGDGARVEAKYGARGLRFLLLEAGHLMQNLCLQSASLGLSTVPLGGFLEGDIAHALKLPATDVVLYVGVCGAVLSASRTS